MIYVCKCSLQSNILISFSKAGLHATMRLHLSMVVATRCLWQLDIEQEFPSFSQDDPKDNFEVSSATPGQHETLELLWLDF